MTEQQYRQLLENRRRRVAGPLFDAPVVERVLRAAARSMRRRERAEKALEAVLPPELLAPTRVDSVEGGTLSIVVSDPVISERLRRQVTGLQRQLARRVPGLRQVRVSQSGQPDAGGEGATSREGGH